MNPTTRRTDRAVQYDRGLQTASVPKRDKISLVLFQVYRDHAAVGLVDGDTPATRVSHKGRLCAVYREIELRAIF
jgi:hypothetical protein